jgi:hypothetical protein
MYVGGRLKQCAPRGIVGWIQRGRAIGSGGLCEGADYADRATNVKGE